ncbi:sensor histidine kinase [Flavobacterium sp. BFFFF1]|uniref:sensor histidine kinase n=1 Tax=Flavobacterium sp. BFFFF1 TaxID=2015557 RepID=UPI0025C738C7|nr:sensor histidine kinase [Flavobacterium sp. BFFFF1]
MGVEAFSQQKEITWSTDSESLPQNSIKSIAPDKYGFIWMATENGLVRFDGKDFKIFDSQNTGIRNNRIRYIRGNYKKDSLYTTNENSEDLIFLHQRKAAKVNAKRHKNVWPLEPGKNNLFTSEGTPSYFFGKWKRPYKIELPSGESYAIQNDSIYSYSAKHKLNFAVSFIYEANRNFFVVDDHLVYLEKDGRCSIIDRSGIQNTSLPFKVMPDLDIFWNLAAEQAFIYNDKNLYQLTMTNGNIAAKLLIKNQNLKTANVWSIYLDKKNSTVYLGSIKKGLGVYKLQYFHTINPDQSQHPETYEIFYALHPFTDNSIVSASGIFMDNRKITSNLEFYTDKYAIAVDKNGDIWNSYFSLLHRYKKSDNFKTCQEWDFTDDISSIYAARNGTIFFNLSKRRENKGSLYCFKESRNPEFEKIADTDFKINYISEDLAGTIWLGTKKGLYMLSAGTNRLKPIPGTENIKIRSIYIDREQHIWFTSYEKGFFLYDHQQVCTFPKDKNNFLTSAHCIVEDSKGFFWITTNKGLFQVKKQRLLDFAANKLKALYYHYYDKSFGFLSNEFNGGCQPCAAQLPNGNIYLPSLMGVVVFNPDDISPVVPDDGMYIDDIIVDEKKIPVEKSLKLSKDFERVTFFITSPYFGNPANLNFEAKLDGPDAQDWTDVSKDHSISFTKLHPGKYTLTIRKLSGFDSNYTYITTNIEIPEAFWQTIWFKLLILLAAAVGIYLIYTFRMQYIRKRNILLEKTINEQTHDLKNTISTLRTTKENLSRQIESNTKIMSYITHDIKAPLKFMSMASQIMYESENESPEEVKENLKAIFSSSTQMYNFIDNLLEYSKAYVNNGFETEEFSLYKVAQDKIALFQGIANSQKTTIRNIIPRDAALKTNRQLFSIIIHNILDNAIKYTGNGTIIITYKMTDDRIEIIVKDTGIGMNVKTIQYYAALMDNYQSGVLHKKSKLGLHIVIELLLVLNGKLSLESFENKGTTVRISFPKN